MVQKRHWIKCSSGDRFQIVSSSLHLVLFFACFQLQFYSSRPSVRTMRRAVRHRLTSCSASRTNTSQRWRKLELTDYRLDGRKFDWSNVTAITRIRATTKTNKCSSSGSVFVHRRIELIHFFFYRRLLSASQTGIRLILDSHQHKIQSHQLTDRQLTVPILRHDYLWTQRQCVSCLSRDSSPL